MGLTIATFVPDGIVLSSDSLAEVRNQDDGYTQTENRKIFVKSGRFVVAFEGNLFLEGLPISAYVPSLFPSEIDTLTVRQFAESLRNNINSRFPDEPFMAYVAGFDHPSYQEACPVVYFIDDKNIACINQSPEGKLVYNFHSIGRTFWVNRLMLQVKAFVGDDTIELEKYDIDFTKYSTAYAKRFSESLIKLSESMDSFSQLKRMIGGKLQTVILSNDGEVSFHDFED